MSRYLHGIHDIGGEHLHRDRPGWTLASEAIGLNPRAFGRDYRPVSDRGIGVMVRLNHGYGSAGTIPLPDKYEAFAAACASYVASSQGATHWIIGNEPNHEGERPNGVVITAEQYVRCFNLCRNAIKVVDSHAQVIPAAMAPFHANPTRWTDYMREVYSRLLPLGGCDGINIHAYARSMNPDELTSRDTMGGVLAGTYSGFLTYRDALEQVPMEMVDLPAYLTEFDVYGDWLNQNTGIIQAMYDEVHHWNSMNAQYGSTQIVAALCFRWLGPPEAENFHDWEMRNKPELLSDFAEAVATGYRSPDTKDAAEKPFTVTFPQIIKGGGQEQVDDLSGIDPRLIERGMKVERKNLGPGVPVWRLVGARWFNREEAGGRHHIYIETLDEAGKPVAGIPIFTQTTDGANRSMVRTNGRLGFDAANRPMSPGENAFMVLVDGGDTVRGIGMGQSTPSGFNAGEHTATVLTYRLLTPQTAATNPLPVPPSVPARGIGTLSHPIGDPALRRLTQRFDANPQDYARFGIKGHTGLDFGVPTGTPVLAADDGVVGEVGFDAEGYGLYVELHHPWGESLYAHLSQRRFEPNQVGQPVQRGAVIGLSGYSGNVDPPGPSGAHLHFAIRVHPYKRGWPYDGFSDPAPYLSDVVTAPTPAPTQGPQGSSKEIVGMILSAAGEFGVDWRVLLSLIHAESSLNPRAYNTSSGAKGLGQIMPLTWGEWSKKVGARDIFDPKDNARVTAAYLKWCIDQMEGRVRRGLWAYVWGVGKVQRNPNDVPAEVIEYATKVIHGAEVLSWANP